MTKKERIVQSIFSAVDQVNRLMPREQKIEKSISAVVYGESGTLDSLGLVNLVVAIEQKIEEEFGTPITLALSRKQGFSRNENPLRTVETIADRVDLLLEKSADEPKRT